MPESLYITNTCQSAVFEEIPPWLPLITKPDSIRWGNSRGLTLLEWLDRHNAELQSLRHGLGATETSLETTQTRVTHLESKLSSLKLEMVTLKQESDACLTLRNRFFATFRRDILQNVVEKDRATTSAGNYTAHGCDFLANAKLFEKNLRS